MKIPSYEEALRVVFEDNLAVFERNALKAFTDPEDREVLAEMIIEWIRLGPIALQKLSMNEVWNIPLYLTISAAITNRREVNKLGELLSAAEG